MSSILLYRTNVVVISRMTYISYTRPSVRNNKIHQEVVFVLFNIEWNQTEVGINVTLK